jgi:hypothetical protein
VVIGIFHLCGSLFFNPCITNFMTSHDLAIIVMWFFSP